MASAMLSSAGRPRGTSTPPRSVQVQPAVARYRCRRLDDHPSPVQGRRPSAAQPGEVSNDKRRAQSLTAHSDPIQPSSAAQHTIIKTSICDLYHTRGVAMQAGRIGRTG